jgi:IK cytokine
MFQYLSIRSQPLTNADFRKLLMTPRAAPSETPQFKKPEKVREKPDRRSLVRNEERKKKKSYYAKLRKDEEERQKELASKYRDRAKERREGDNRDYEQTELISTTADYRAVAPDAKS